MDSRYTASSKLGRRAAPGDDPRRLRVLPRRLLGLGALLAILVAGSAMAADDLAAVRSRIERNGWGWEADDTFIKSRTPAERENLRGYVPPPDLERILQQRRRMLPVAKDLPQSFDWRGMNGTTPVKDQGSCGSCWAFAAVGQLESLVKIYYGEELNLSEQQVISCNPYGSGCNGGWAGSAYWVFENHGAIHEDCMPYVAANADNVRCTETDHWPLAGTTDWYSIANNVDQIKSALLLGPVCTGMDAEGDFEDYGSGCYDGPGYSVNHLVLIVGWDDRMCDNQGGWIVKNSWGASFGENGYFKIKYGAALIGSSCTQAEYEAPPVTVSITAPGGFEDLTGDQQTLISWSTTGGDAGAVDIYFGQDGYCCQQLVAEGLPNDGNYLWTVPNQATQNARLMIFPHAAVALGHGFSLHPLTILGHKIRYVSLAGSNTPPYESPETAAHTIAEAVTACAGFDSVMVATGDYLETVTISRTVQLFGGWSADFSQRDTELYPTRMQGINSALRFFSAARDFGAVDGFLFENCRGGAYAAPEPGRHGGAIYSLDCSLTIRSCVFRANQAASGDDFGLGGAVLTVGGSPVLQDNVFADNRATRGGAVALYDAVSASLSGNVFLGNSCQDSLSGNQGAALLVHGGQVSSAGDRFENNGGAGQGGALYLAQTSFDGSDLQMSGNRARLQGGAVCAEQTALCLSGSVITGNSSASSGGGMLLQGGLAILQNLHVAQNQAAMLGGGLMLIDGIGGRLENCLIAGNTAGQMNGGLAASSSAALMIRNNIVTGNQPSGLTLSGDGVVADFNDVWGNTGEDYFYTAPGAHDIMQDPLFVDAAGGDYGLALHSPCVDRGDPAEACADPDGSPADMGLLGGPLSVGVAPAAVAGAQIEILDEGEIALSWTPNAEPDVAQYIVYRDTSTIFFPMAQNMVAVLSHPAHTWQDTPPTSCYYVVAALDADGHMGGFSDQLPSHVQTAVADPGVPARLALASVAPNPFNPRTTIQFDVPRSARVQLRVFDVRGRLVASLVDELLPAGRHTCVWQGRDGRGAGAAAGVYFLRLSAGDQAVTSKLILAK